MAEWQGRFYVDLCLPMGCSISCSLFESFSTFLEWVVKKEAGVRSVLHYLDDFLCIGPPKSFVCASLLAAIQSVFKCFGVPLASDKTEGPSTLIKFLGILIDSEAMECRLPDDKVSDLLEAVREARSHRKIRLKDLQSLLGKMNFACRIIPMGRVFCRRLAAATSGITFPHHFVRLARTLKDDLAVWEQFLIEFNGRSLWIRPPVSNFDLDIHTDAAGSTGFGAYCSGQWCADRWPESWRNNGLTRNLVLLELFPIVVACEIWYNIFQNRKVRFHCDNLGVVEVINKQSASSLPVVTLLRHLVLRCLKSNCQITAVHVPGVCNSVADALSRFQWDRFRSLAPMAEVQGKKCPDFLWSLPVTPHTL
ncbi:uncharacterized protein ACNLHF_009217 [Anomaloglossus baeobatrachus]